MNGVWLECFYGRGADVEMEEVGVCVECEGVDVVAELAGEGEV